MNTFYLFTRREVITLLQQLPEQIVELEPIFENTPHYTVYKAVVDLGAVRPTIILVGHPDKTLAKSYFIALPSGRYDIIGDEESKIVEIDVGLLTYRFTFRKNSPLVSIDASVKAVETAIPLPLALGIVRYYNGRAPLARIVVAHDEQYKVVYESARVPDVFALNFDKLLEGISPPLALGFLVSDGGVSITMGIALEEDHVASLVTKLSTAGYTAITVRDMLCAVCELALFFAAREMSTRIGITYQYMLELLFTLIGRSAPTPPPLPTTTPSPTPVTATPAPRGRLLAVLRRYAPFISAVALVGAVAYIAGRASRRSR